MRTPNESGYLDLDGQSIYWEEWGTPAGLPALYLHGGPGSGLGDSGYVKRFELERYRLVALDQRGCGRSVPVAGSPGHDLAGNTTARLVADVEALREHLGITAWVVNGVSWGSTLALAYAQAHPQRVLGIVLMAVTTTGASEVEWITEGCRILYPEAWDELATFVEENHRTYRRGEDRLIDAIASLLQQEDPSLRQAVATAWGRWEDWHVSIAAGYSPDPRWQDPAFGVTLATLVTHYWSNHAFLDPPILDRVDRLAGIPGYLIHGRRDVSGPAVTAWELHRRWPTSTLTIVEDEGHGGPRMVAAWAQANAELADRLTRPA